MQLNNGEIVFPDWVELPKRQSEQALAAKRLRYMIIVASCRNNSGCNVASFAKAIGKDRSIVHQCIKLGRFSPALAGLCEQVFGKTVIRAEWLMAPLEISTK